MAAANEAAAAAAAADALTPSEDHMVSVAGGASSAGKASEDRAADAVQRYAATTNLSQLRRWAASVANMRSAAALVLQGFQEAAAAAAEELEPLTAPFDL
ncbi:hypothetical protein DUNSADRAFT_2598 [Dunaliella salina]|uniref:Uncharacterized protein n=1 Tax=Dunaliella salina TaxID=3046 RepID=A0ABQ7GVA4_DUNSA|nr:hypothetical protein DUNSADRAFT_2598 [Dunaliella salina]|eukprot:KAF5838537.1 hypothetical protein DUNSADRAFT_2598 [Dunaliella salina]